MDPAAFGRIVNELVKSGHVELTGRGQRGVKFYVLSALGETFVGCDLLSKLPSPEFIRSAHDCATERSGQLQ